MIERMSYSTTLKTNDIFLQAFVNDPIQLYLWEDLPTCPRWKPWLRQQARRFRMAYTAATALRSGLAYQVGGGKGFVLASYAKADRPPTSFAGKILNSLAWLPNAIGKVYECFVWRFIISTQQQLRRGAEIESKMEATIERVLGDNGDQYMSLSHIACAPELQGKGHGKALVRAITDIADAKHRKVWLLSSNIRNNRFYQSCGFEVVEEFTLDSSPPIVVQMMIYKPQE